ncbi:MAG TPA: alpha/beta hydrolase [Dongiaceae bacterium]|nr:alpha/beta hydrolase [Dongiaceae bacterium]
MSRSAVKALNARMVGNGEEVLVLAHGLGTNQTAWSPFLPALVDHYTIVLYDLACAGSVDPAYFDFVRHHEIAGHVDDLLEIVTALRLQRCIFLGHSVSGMIGLLAAQRLPDAFSQLMLLGASPRYIDDGDYRGGMDGRDVAAIFDAIASNYRNWASSLAPIVVGEDPDHPATTSFLSSLLAMRPDIALAMFKGIFTSDYRRVLPHISPPVTVLQSREDAAVPLSAAKYLYQHLPNSELVIVEASGHLPHCSAPAAFVSALTGRLRGIERVKLDS